MTGETVSAATIMNAPAETIMAVLADPRDGHGPRRPPGRELPGGHPRPGVRPAEPSGVSAGGELTCEHERVTVQRVTRDVRR
jgi:hypothetical protein